MAAIGNKFKRFTAALPKATLAGASASARFLRSKLAIALVLWNKLPEKGWPSGFVDFLKHPPRWFVGPCSALAIWVVGSLLLRLVWAVAGSGADEVSKLLIGLAGLLGAPFLIWRTWIADRQRHIAQEELYTGLLVKAVEQLGATREEKTESGGKIVSNTEVRLGAIYALEKLSRDYEPLHRQIMEILCAYVRKNTEPPRFCSAEIRAIYSKRRWHDETDDEKAALRQRIAKLQPPCVDVQAALTVIGRRSEKQREFEMRIESENAGAGGFRLDLRGCDLTSTDLRGLRFEGADLSGSCLEGAMLSFAHLEGAVLNSAHLEGAMLIETHLERAMLSYAHLEGAVLSSAHLEGAMLSYAHLEGARLDQAYLEHAALGLAHLEGAYLTFVETLTQGQLNSAYGDESTQLPSGLSRPVNERWRRASNPLDARSG
jgi:uncharacterized protein YjbI with pentapeptide repeats